uniref:Uncharacterized protein n=1 Tax=Ixodes ricinus TaxID=34613 RepID=A0A147BKU0_IXORI
MGQGRLTPRFVVRPKSAFSGTCLLLLCPRRAEELPFRRAFANRSLNLRCPNRSWWSSPGTRYNTVGRALRLAKGLQSTVRLSTRNRPRLPAQALPFRSRGRTFARPTCCHCPPGDSHRNQRSRQRGSAAKKTCSSMHAFLLPVCSRTGTSLIRRTRRSQVPWVPRCPVGWATRAANRPCC